MDFEKNDIKIIQYQLCNIIKNRKWYYQYLEHNEIDIIQLPKIIKAKNYKEIILCYLPNFKTSITFIS